MAYLVQVEKITGLAEGESACGVFNKRVSTADGNLGTVVAGILLKSQKEVDLAAITRDIFELSVKKLEGVRGGILAALISAKNAASEYARAKNLEVSFIYTFFFEDVCYVVRLGDRVKLLVFEAPKSVEITFESGSGPLGDGQVYLIATEKFLSIFDTADLKREAEVDFRDIIDGIATEIVGEKNQSEIGAAFVITKGTEKETEGTEDVATSPRLAGQAERRPYGSNCSKI